MGIIIVMLLKTILFVLKIVTDQQSAGIIFAVKGSDAALTAVAARREKSVYMTAA